MAWVKSAARAFFGIALSIAACAPTNERISKTSAREQVLQELQRQAGAPISLEVGNSGELRVLAMTPKYSIPGRDRDPTFVATDFITQNHDLFQLDATDARQFVVTRVDDDPATELQHVTLNRVVDGIPVFQGAIRVHMDANNSVFRVVGDESYRIAPPVNRVVLSPSDAVEAAGKAFGLKLAPVLTEQAERRSVFTSPGALDPLQVEQRIVHVAEGNDRIAYQTTVSWLDASQQQQYELALIDAQDGALLASYSLVNTFTGRVFSTQAQPRANQTGDTRTLVSFDGNPETSPIGWVGSARTTAGNNAIAATDLDGNNTIGANEVQPTANADGSFDFPYSPAQDPSNFRAAAVANAFFYVNDHHDRAYMVGFTETAGNFQANNFGKGGAQNDPVNVDVQDSASVNTASIATPPDGSRPRMQLFLFTLPSGVRRDSAFDPTVVYHEITHAMANRVVGGGSAACLTGLHPAGLAEGWSDFVAAQILNNPVIGAYVSGNPTTGIRRASMASSPFTYGDLNGTLKTANDVGELWAAVLWDIRVAIGSGLVCPCVLTAMKLTPCNPNLIQARDALLQSDANLNGGINRCALWTVFANRGLGVGAQPPKSGSTQVVPSNAVPPNCVVTAN